MRDKSQTSKTQDIKRKNQINDCRILSENGNKSTRTNFYYQIKKNYFKYSYIHTYLTYTLTNNTMDSKLIFFYIPNCLGQIVPFFYA